MIKQRLVGIVTTLASSLGVLQTKEKTVELLKIYKDTDPELRVVCKDVTEFSDQLEELAKSMWATMQIKGGVGLAANQVGLDMRMICVKDKDFSGVMINPNWSPDEKLFLNIAEGCLSLPGKNIKKERYATINVNFLDLDGKKHKITVRGLTARIVQHEVDHLDGILMTDEV